MNQQYDIPILILIFNRPQHTKKTFEVIKKIQPKFLYIASDGARPEVAGEIEIVAQTRSIFEKLDWNCEIKTLYRDRNLGCTMSVTSSISWFFENVEYGIILEDDCLCDSSFFMLCEEVLPKYKDNEQIMHISGSNFLNSKKHENRSYYFSKFISCWGWASWKRAWKKFRIDLPEIVAEKEHIENIEWIATNKFLFEKWYNLFQYHRTGEDNIWDYRWQYNIWHHRGICITVSQNLVSNIGYGELATTSTGKNKTRNKIAALRVLPLTSIQHPYDIEIDAKKDYKTQLILHPKTINFQTHYKEAFTTEIH